MQIGKDPIIYSNNLKKYLYLKNISPCPGTLSIMERRGNECETEGRLETHS